MPSPARRMGLWACALTLCGLLRSVPALVPTVDPEPAAANCQRWVELYLPQGPVVRCGDVLPQSQLPQLQEGDGVTIGGTQNFARLPQAMANTTRLALGLPIDINHAEAHVLALVPGISPRLAAQLVNHRTAHGCFRSLDELTSVRGLGPATLRRVRPQFFVSPAALANPYGPLL